jgi:purine-binding chemotaxis protein CheW
VSNVREIYPPQLLTAVPRTPHFLAGVFSARGRILSAIDLASFLGLPARPHRELAQTKIIVVTPTGPTAETIQLELGLLVDEVTDIITIFEDEAELSLATHTGVDYIRGITSDLLVVLDLNALLSDKRLIVNEEVL